jgi:hypothetical protein
MADICGTDFNAFFNGTVVPLMFYASIGTSVLIGLSYMLGNAIGNARLTVWSKTEIMQLFISVATLFFIILAMETMCAINMNEVAGIFGVPSPTATTVNVYDAAQQYLNESALYSHNALKVVRYHLEGYTILAYLNAFKCDFNTGNIGWGCMFGWSGENQQPVGGFGAMTAALNIFFNSLIVAHFTVLNYIFILMFVYRGFVFLFLPLGVFMRAMPYMRGFGALLIALGLSFLIVYPFMLGVFWLMRGTLVDAGTSFSPPDVQVGDYNEKKYPDNEGAAAVGNALITVSYKQVKETYFGDDSKLEKPAEAIAFAANAFIAAVFLPTVALLATIASVTYMARLYGEEIDLSRITQLV